MKQSPKRRFHQRAWRWRIIYQLESDAPSDSSRHQHGVKQTAKESWKGSASRCFYFRNRLGKKETAHKTPSPLRFASVESMLCSGWVVDPTWTRPDPGEMPRLYRSISKIRRIRSMSNLTERS